MTNDALEFALFGNTYQEKNEQAIRQTLCCLASHGARVHIDRPFYHWLVQEGLMEHEADTFDGDRFSAHFALSLGGDGTFLKAAGRVGAKPIPIVGINMGRLGFLADVMPDEVEGALGEIFAGQFSLEAHAVIEVEVDGETFDGNPFAVNDVAVLKRDNAAMISIHASINGEELVTYQADGLIVATPAGSTAYSLSNGGPIIVPGTHSFILTPVAPHSLNVRPIVVSDDVCIELRVESRSHCYLVAVDGRSRPLTEGATIRLRKAPYAVQLVRRQGQSYFATLRNKMMWGADRRTPF